jgi:hypothetical protein
MEEASMREAIVKEIDFLKKRLDNEGIPTVWKCIWVAQINSYERILEADERKLPDGK